MAQQPYMGSGLLFPRLLGRAHSWQLVTGGDGQYQLEIVDASELTFTEHLILKFANKILLPGLMPRREGKYPAKNILHYKNYLENMFCAIQSVTIAAHTRNQTGNISKALLHFTFIVRSFLFYFISHDIKFAFHFVHEIHRFAMSICLFFRLNSSCVTPQNFEKKPINAVF
jgi:hypothetical protein